MSHTEREQQAEFEELIGKFMEGAADWENQGWVGPEARPRVRGAIPTRGLPTRGAVRTRGAAVPSAEISTIAELIEEVKPRLSKASLILVLDGDYNKAAVKFCEALRQVVDKELVAWWIRSDGRVSPQWPWSDVVELDWNKARDRQIAEGLAPDIVFVSASPQGAQLQRVARWRSAQSIIIEEIIEESPETASPALDTMVGPRIFIFTREEALRPYGR